MEPNLPAMSANPSNEGNPYIHRISGGIPASCPSVKFLKSAFDEVDQHCSLDILPILFDKAQVSSKLKYPFHRSHRVLQRQTSPKVGGNSCKYYSTMALQKVEKMQTQCLIWFKKSRSPILSPINYGNVGTLRVRLSGDGLVLV